MTRRHFAIAILIAWVLSLGWLVRREVFRPTGARLEEAALAVPPGALFYRLDVGGQQVGFLSSTIDTLPDSIRVENFYLLDVAALGRLQRTKIRSIAMLSRGLKLQRVNVTIEGDMGAPDYEAHGRVLGDTILAVAVVSGAGTDSQMTRIPLRGAITLPTLLPLRLAFGGALQSGRTSGARLFDPLLIATRNVSVHVSAESTLVVSDSADLDSTTMVWVAKQYDTVRAFRLEQDVEGSIPLSTWIDEQGRLVRASNPTGFSMERAAFEIAYENFRRRDTARVARNSRISQPNDVVPVTMLTAGVQRSGAEPNELRVRFSGGRPLPGWNEGRQRAGGDTLTITREGAIAANATPYRLPSRDSALARWLAPEPLIQSHDPRIAAQARQVLGNRDRSPARAARLLAAWVHDNVRPIAAARAGIPSAQKVLDVRQGDCDEIAILYVALARSAGLPARTVSGVIYASDRFYYHSWAEVYLGEWIAVDPLLNQYPADAAHVRVAIGGLARQVELVPLIGRLKLEVL